MIKCCKKRLHLGSVRADEPGATFNPNGKKRALLKATSRPQASVVQSYDCSVEGGTCGCEGLKR